MHRRRLKPILDPLQHPASQGSKSPPLALNGGATDGGGGSGLKRGASPHSTTTPADCVASPSINVYSCSSSGGGSSCFGSSGIPPVATVLVENHVSNTGAVVRLVQLDYGTAIRIYRLYREERFTPSLLADEVERSASGLSGGSYAGGTCPPYTFAVDSMSPYSTAVERAPWSLVLQRLFSAADMVLIAFFLSCFVALAVQSQQRRFADGVMGLALSAVVGSGNSASSSRTDVVDAATPATPSSVPLGPQLLPLLLSAAALLLRLYRALTRVYVEEILVLRGVGLQCSTYGIWNTLRQKQFTDVHLLRSIVIHDAFFRLQPIFYLSSSIENRASRLVYFSETLPRLAVLQPVLNGIRFILFGEEEKGLSLAALEELKSSTATFEGLGEFSAMRAEDSWGYETATTADDTRSSEPTECDED